MTPSKIKSAKQILAKLMLPKEVTVNLRIFVPTLYSWIFLAASLNFSCKILGEKRGRESENSSCPDVLSYIFSLKLR